VGPAPNLDIDTIGVPQSICKTQTIPVKVTAINMNAMVDVVKRGDASSVLTKDGRKIVLGRKILPRVEVGMTVNRHLVDGDWVVFNRQPSLHKESMMGHKVKVVSGNTFRLSVACTTPYNAGRCLHNKFKFKFKFVCTHKTFFLCSQTSTETR
jgi:DNA-directed RNA polymerase beta' subunit